MILCYRCCNGVYDEYYSKYGAIRASDNVQPNSTMNVL